MRLPPAIERALAQAHEKAARGEAERALAVERERTASILSALPDAVWSADPVTGRVFYVSPQTSAIYGRASSEFLARGDCWIDAIHPEDKPSVLEAWRRLHDGGQFDLEYRIVRPDGEERWCRCVGQVQRDASGTPVRLTGVDQDITAQVLADKIAALGGTPASAPAPVPVVADAKAMLQAALKAEVETIDRYVNRRKQAEATGEYGLAAEFDQIIADETNHRDELQQMLARWP